ncbi:MAG: hypothetical protein KDK89_18555 [Alphaproteobacteria bacterium]|nr:hypothetical protein [Alphaproteobacteria bacterium]
MDIAQLIIQVVAGGIGGNVSSAALKDKNLGFLGDSIAGFVGGGISSQALKKILAGGAVAGRLDMAAIIQQIAGGGIGGAILMAMISTFKTTTRG